MVQHFILLRFNLSALWRLGETVVWAIYVISAGLLVSRGNYKCFQAMAMVISSLKMGYSDSDVSWWISIYIYIWVNSLANRLRVVADAFRPTTKQLIGEFHKSEVLLIASTLLVVKAKNIYWNTIKMHKMMKTELSHQTAFTNFVPRHKAVH